MVDVSSNNHVNDDPINWHSVAGAGYRAVMIKATEGLNYVNPWLARDADGAHTAGLHVGFYHFAMPAVGEADDQAEFVVNAVNGLPRDLGIALDLEVMNGLSWADLSTFGENFLARLVQLGVKYSTLYSNDNFMANLSGAPFGHYLWLAQTAQPRQQVWGWQTTSPAAVPGIPGLTDIDTLYVEV